MVKRQAPVEVYRFSGPKAGNASGGNIQDGKDYIGKRNRRTQQASQPSTIFLAERGGTLYAIHFTDDHDFMAPTEYRRGFPRARGR